MEPEVTAASSDARDLAVRARDRVRFEEDALAYADDAFRVARRLTGSTEEADTVVERLSQGGVVSALAALSQPYRDAVVLVDLADFSYQDAADILDVPIGTIMSRLHRGRRMLKTELAQTIEDTAEAAAS